MIRWTLVLAIAALLGLVRPAWAIYPPPIKDDGKFFSKEGVEKANKKIRALYENYKKDVIVETVATLPSDQERKLKDEGGTKFFAKLASDRGKEVGLNGIYVILCKSPKHLQVHMDPQTQKKAFTAANRKTLLDRMVAQLKEEKFDAALDAALAEIESAFKANSQELPNTTK